MLNNKLIKKILFYFLFITIGFAAKAATVDTVYGSWHPNWTNPMAMSPIPGSSYR